MCNLSTGILERGMEKGMKKGMEKGIKKGMMDTLFSLVRNNMLTINVAAKQANMDASAFRIIFL